MILIKWNTCQRLHRHLDIYADEMTTYSDLRPMLNIKCSNEEIKAVLENLYSKVLNVEYNLFGWARTMCKYGDFFLVFRYGR